MTKSVCLFFCLLAYLENHTTEHHQIYFCVLPLARGHCDTLCTSGFVDDIMFSHNGLYIWCVVCIPKRRERNSRNSWIDSNHCNVGLASFLRRFTLNYENLATKYPWIYGYFFTKYGLLLWVVAAEADGTAIHDIVQQVRLKLVSFSDVLVLRWLAGLAALRVRSAET